jgi:hypothetical protein
MGSKRRRQEGTGEIHIVGRPGELMVDEGLPQSIARNEGRHEVSVCFHDPVLSVILILNLVLVLVTNHMQRG